MKMNFKEEMKSELSLIPFMLGKVLSGGLSVVGMISGFIMIVVKVRYHESVLDPSVIYIISSFALAVFGIILFWIFDHKLRAKMMEDKITRSDFTKFTKKDLINWGILLIIATIFIAGILLKRMLNI